MTMPAPIRILLVDDKPAIRAGLASVLTLYPEFQIAAEASTGVDALRLHAQHHPELTLMDVRLPGMDGIQALSAIRTADAQPRVVMLSSEALQAGVCQEPTGNLGE